MMNESAIATGPEWTVCRAANERVLVRSPAAGGSHLVVYTPGDDPRIDIGTDLQDYLNGGARPASVRDAKRMSDTRCKMSDGVLVAACGPYTWRRRDGEPTVLCDDSNSAWDARRLLMDRLFECRLAEGAS